MTAPLRHADSTQDDALRESKRVDVEPSRTQPVPRDTDERYRLIVDQVSDYGIFMLDPQGRIASWNAGAERIHGYREDEVLGREFSIFYPQADRDAGKPARELAIAIRDGRYAEEGVRVRKNGETFWASVVITALRDADGQLRGFAKVTRDITEMHRMVESLRQSEERMRVMIDVVRDYAIFMLDPTGHVVSWNSGAQRLKGYRADEIIGRSFETFYTEPDRARGHPQDELRRAKAEGRYEEEGWRVRKDGTTFWANVVITAAFDQRGQHIGFTKVTRDFTERRIAEQRLKESEERFRLIIEGVRDYAIFMLDPTGHVSTWNTGAENIKGYRAEEIIGQHFSVFYPPEAAAKGLPERELQIARDEGRYEEEGWRVRKDGRLLWANVVLRAIRDEHGVLRGFAKVTRDLTERRRLEQEAREAERKATEERERAREAQLALKIRDEFLSIAAHELRTPLTSLHLKIQGVEDILSKRAPDPRLLDRFRSAGRQVRRLTDLIERLLDVSRIVGGRLEIHRETMDMSAMVAEIVEDFREPAHQAGSELRIHAPSPVTGAWDRARLEQVVVNLLSNAIKYGSGKPIEVGVELVDGRGVLTIRDHGIGIGSDDLVRIFDRFERAEAAKNFGGLGLGLYITRHIVEGHDGKIRVESEPGVGSTFIVELPREAVERSSP